MTNNNPILPAIPDKALTTPVLFMVFNRPETTSRVFEAIRKAKPTRLYIAADGPRKDRPDDAGKCAEVRAIVSDVDWECSVQTLFRDNNLGCGEGLTASITWFFENEEEGIILEDDCLPSPLFFLYCAELLERYRYDTRVMEIGGNNFLGDGAHEEKYSYRFSNLTYIWGWATWRRAWKHNDYYMRKYKEITENGYLDKSYDTIYERDFYQYVFEKMYKGDSNISSRTIWSFQWQFACKINSGLIIVPNCNLVVNLGFGDFATNTHNPRAVGYDLVLEDIQFPLKHPEFVIVNQTKDNEVFTILCTNKYTRIKSHIKNFLPSPVLEKFVKPFLSLFSTRARNPV